MATKTFVSAGVFTNEIDASFLPQAVGEIGGAFVGLTQKGPAFLPVKVTNFQEAADLFGDVNPDFKMSYYLKSYLRNANAASVVRVLGPSGRSVNGSAVSPGYTPEKIGVVLMSGSVAGDGSVVAVFELTGNAHFVVSDPGDSRLTISITGSATVAATVVTCSLVKDGGNAPYIRDVLNTDPTKASQHGYWLRSVYDFELQKRQESATVGFGGFRSGSVAFATYTSGFQGARTPWVKSQDFLGIEHDLFKVHTLGHGNAENGRFSVTVENIKASPNAQVTQYGTFTLVVRELDTKNVVEQFVDVTLDKTSRSYVAKAVGDRVWSFDQTKNKVVSSGDYENKSRFIRIEMTTGSIPALSLPWGFRGFPKPANTTLANTGSTGVSSWPSLPLAMNLRRKTFLVEDTSISVNSNEFWGVDSVLSGNINDRLGFLPDAFMTDKDSDFSLKFVSGSTEDELRYDTTITMTASLKSPGTALAHSVLEPKYAKFLMPLAHGFDGFDPRIEDPIENTAQLLATTQIGVQALRQGVDVVSDPDFIDINLLSIPGVWSSKVVEYALQKVEERGDAFYVMDLSSSSVNTMVNEVNNRKFVSNYAATYYPDLMIADQDNGVNVTLPASFAAVSAIAYNDSVAYPWYAAAGLSRGALKSDTIGFSIVKLIDPPNQAERDKLYENRVNPIAQFSNGEFAIWGQKTLQLKDSALNRINVRRLMIKAKKVVSSAVKFLVFEPNNPRTWQQFENLVNPILKDIQMKNGIENFKVVMNSSTNTPDLIDRGVMKGKLYIIPTKSAEIISLDFVLGRTGATFEDI